jgi:FMN phosphatase YigB (HAD superfamily)
MIQAVFFDFNDTLCDSRAAVEAAAAEACDYAVSHAEALSATGLREAYAREVRHAEEEARRWVASRPATSSGLDQRAYRLWERALEKCGVVNPILAHAVALHYQLARMRALRLFPDAMPALQALQGRVRVGVIAEGSPGLVTEELGLLEIRGLFTVTVIEGEAGYARRDPQLFAYALREAGCEASQAAHVGDSFECDVTPAHEVGMITVWVNREPEKSADATAPAPDYTVSDLGPVPDLLLGLP